MSNIYEVSSSRQNTGYEEFPVLTATAMRNQARVGNECKKKANLIDQIISKLIEDRLCPSLQRQEQGK